MLKGLTAATLLTMGLNSLSQAADLPAIEKSGVLKVVTEDNYAPFNFITNGKPDGFNKDVLVELKKYTHKFKIKQSILPWTGLLAAVSSGQYDVAITGALITDDRLKALNFVAPLASAQDFYVKRAGDNRIKSVADLSGKTLGVQAGSALLARLPELVVMLAKTGGKLGKVVQYQSYPEAYADLANGRLDYVINAVISVNDVVKKHPNIFAKGQAVSGHGFVAWPVPKSSPKLLAFLDGFVKHLKDTGKLKELQLKWFGQAFDNLPDQPITNVEEFHRLAGI
ncbi:transporter substrate-binding domain-containing protein [Celerinatantimonas yamalensis]|uniref:Transporter substrate-binding domain-containing protein n=1 Tax=Celerinatantimonas yamalensis TaxID=559956 RepID=A0ABW9G7Y6_9GAMM